MSYFMSSVWAPRRVASGVLALVLLGAAIALYADGSGGWWVFPAFALGPDLAFLLGIGQAVPIQRGQMPARAVPAYNALHRVWGPALLGLLAGTGLLPEAFLVGALVWGTHVFLDRALGYGLRTRDGLQRT